MFSIGVVGGWLGRRGRPVGQDTTNFDANRFSGEAFERRSVLLGTSGGDRVEVRKGLNPGEQVAIDGAFLLKSELLR